ncbi:FACT complex subunit SSRP1-like [Silene latifolia]|uniref:FACT complex subunit SSRP1-like n=1 Tax=Silene latifolia TaxID=37657 RepID=UPI003D780D07
MEDVNLDNNSSISSHGESESVADNTTMSTMAKIDSKEAIATINGVTVFNPRNTYSVELHLSLLHFVGQTNDFTIHYSSIVDLFSLPESYQPQARTFVVITLDSPICLGETSYPHIVMQFETDCEIKSPPYTSIELLKYKFKDGLESPYSGLIHGFFTKTLSALSSTKITRPGVFRSSQDGSYAVKCNSKYDNGILYPLAECLFFLPEPPTLFHNTEIFFLELQKKVRGSDKRYCDLIVRLRTEPDHHFWNIERSEYYNLKEYFSNIDLEVTSRSDDEVGVFDKFGDPDSSDTDGEQEMRVKREKGSKKPTKHGDSQKRKRIKKELSAPKPITTAFLFFSESEQENVRKENPSITFTDIGKIMEEKWRNISDAEREPYEAKAQADRKRYLDEIVEYNYHQEPNKTASRYLSWLSKVQALKTRDDKDEDFITNSLGVVSSADNFVEDSDSDDVNDSSSADGVNDTTKCPMVAFLCFSRAEQENTKKENPSATFTDIGRILGEKWSNMSAAEKEPYEAMAQADRQRENDRESNYSILVNSEQYSVVC